MGGGGFSGLSAAPHNQLGVGGAGDLASTMHARQKHVQGVINDREKTLWNPMATRKYLILFGTCVGDLSRPTLKDLVGRTIDVPNNVFKIVESISGLDPLQCAPPRSGTYSLPVTTHLPSLGDLLVTVARAGFALSPGMTQESIGRIKEFQHRWGLGVTLLHQHISKHLDKAKLPQSRPLMFARLREDLDTFSSELTAYAVNAYGASPVPPATLPSCTLGGRRPGGGSSAEDSRTFQAAAGARGAVALRAAEAAPEGRRLPSPPGTPPVCAGASGTTGSASSGPIASIATWGPHRSARLAARPGADTPNAPPPARV